MFKQLQRTLTSAFISKKAKVPLSMKLLSYIIVGGILCLLFSALLGPANNTTVEGLENPADGNDKTLILFHMNGCGHCVKLMPEWDAFVENNQTRIKTVKYEQGEPKSKPLLKKHSVKGFPTIILVDDAGDQLDIYRGERNEEGLHKFCKEHE